MTGAMAPCGSISVDGAKSSGHGAQINVLGGHVTDGARDGITGVAGGAAASAHSSIAEFSDSYSKSSDSRASLTSSGAATRTAAEGPEGWQNARCASAWMMRITDDI